MHCAFWAGVGFSVRFLSLGIEKRCLKHWLNAQPVLPLVDGKFPADGDVVIGLTWTLSAFPLAQPVIPPAWA